ncbi:MAG TPA: hypothetical protein VML96_12735 [Egibacteraceae bacterium]|nr:hypothetical protein [Egibacteraceae bacterium]
MSEDGSRRAPRRASAGALAFLALLLVPALYALFLVVAAVTSLFVGRHAATPAGIAAAAIAAVPLSVSLRRLMLRQTGA